MATDVSKIVNPEDEILWHKIREAVDRVSFKPQEQITFTVANKEITVVAGTKYITVTIGDYEPEQPVLIKPPE